MPQTEFPSGGTGGTGGSLTSVGVGSNTLSVANSPVTASGTIEVDLPNFSGLPYFNGAALPTLATQTQIANAVGLLGIANGGLGLGTLGSPGQVPTVNPGGTALIWQTPTGGSGGSGTVTSVTVSSNTLSVSGSPITTTGTIDVEFPNVSGIVKANGTTPPTAAAASDIVSLLGTTAINGNAANVTGVVSYQHGGTGLNTLGSPGQVPTVNSAGTAIVWQTPSGGGSGANNGGLIFNDANPVSVQGTLSTTVLKTINIAANAIALNGSLIIEAKFTITNNSDNKTMAILFGTSGAMQTAISSTQSTNNQWRVQISITNRGVANVQDCWNGLNSFAQSSLAAEELSVDTTKATIVQIVGTLTSTSVDTITAEKVSAWIQNP